MKIVTISAWLFASVSMLFGQTTASSVEGQVVSETTGAPVKRATVSLRTYRTLPAPAGQPAPAYRTNAVEADDQGRFAFRNLAPGGYMIGAQRQGFLDPNQGQGFRQNAVLMVGENQQLAGVVVRLTPHSVISGKVLDAYGDPLAAVQVIALRWGYANGKRQLIRAGTGPMPGTNDLGEYRIAGLTAGDYVVMADTPRAANMYRSPDQPLEDTPQLAYTNTYYPAATEAAAATPVRVAAGAETRGIDVKLVKVKTVSIRGRVIEPAPQPNRPASINLIPRRASAVPMLNSVGSISLSSGGVFQIWGVPPGSYYLVTRRNDPQGQGAGASLAIEVSDKNLDGVTLQPSPAVDVDVILKSEPPGRCTGGYASLSDESGYGGTPGINLSAGSQSTFKNVIPSTYIVSVPGNGACYVQSVRFAGRDVADMRVKVDSNGPLGITLAISSAMVDGTVVDAAGKPANSAMVTFVPENGAPQEARMSSTNRTGFFSLPGLRPGAYDVFAWESVEYAAAQSSEYVKAFASRATRVTVAAGARQSLRLTAIPASATGGFVPKPPMPVVKGSVEGQVVHSLTGAPVSGVKVTLGTRPIFRVPAGAAGGALLSTGTTGGQTTPPEQTVDTDEHGRFAIRDVEPDMYYISAEAPGFSASGPPERRNMAGDQIVVGNGQRITGYAIRLAAQSVIAGRVTDEFGEAVTNAQAALVHADYLRGSRRLARVATAQTDDLGKFRLPGIPPGSYYLSVIKRALARSAPVMQAPANQPEMGYGVTWYPNASDFAGASVIAVGAAAEVPVEIVVKRTRVVRLGGAVVDSTGAPVERVSVGLAPRGLGTVISVGSLTILRDGGFEISNVPPGSYLLSARAMTSGLAMPNGAPASLQFNGVQPPMAFLPIEVRDENIEGIKLQLSAGREVRGAVKWEGGLSQSVFLTASAAEGLLATASASPANGGFTLSPVWPLSYAIDVQGLCSTCYVKSMRYDGRDVADAGIDFGGSGELEIVVSAAAASLDLAAVDQQGRPVGGATIIVTTAETTGRILTGRSDARGAFHFGGLRPGSYRVYAWEGAAPETSPEALAPFQAQARTVWLGEGALEKLQIATIKR